MDLVWLASIQVDVCAVCKGVWFDNGELVDLPKRVTDQELAEAAAQMLRSFAKAETIRRPSYLPCPVCAGHLTRNTYRDVSGILTDQCRRCGTWVDNPSILRILQLIAEHRLPESEQAVPPRETPPPRPPIVDREDLVAALRPPLRLHGTGDSEGLMVLRVVWILLEILGYFL
jgi:Zn-finger nucleic acid-binding protein